MITFADTAASLLGVIEWIRNFEVIFKKSIKSSSKTLEKKKENGLVIFKSTTFFLTLFRPSEESIFGLPKVPSSRTNTFKKIKTKELFFFVAYFQLFLRIYIYCWFR